MSIVLKGDWTLVTKNSYDFRGPARAPGSGGQYKSIELHAGLVCLNGPQGMDLHMQRELFEAILDEIERDGDLVNKLLEATLNDAAAEEIDIRRFDLPEA